MHEPSPAYERARDGLQIVKTDAAALSDEQVVRGYRTLWRVERAFREVKDNIDSGQFKAIQVAACEGIANPVLSNRIRRHYEDRLRKMVKILKQVGFEAKMPGGTFYLYVPAPKGAGTVLFPNAEAASQHLIREHLISTVPWDDAGSFLRFGATFESKDKSDDARVLGELESRLKRADLRF